MSRRRTARHLERLQVLRLLQGSGDFLGRGFRQRAVFQQSDDFADEFLVVLGELLAAANGLVFEPFQNVGIVGAAAMRGLRLVRRRQWWRVTKAALFLSSRS